MFLLENDRLKKQLEEVGEKHRIASGDLQDTRGKYEHIKEEYEQVQSQIEALDKAIEEARTSLNDTGLLRGKLEGEIAVLKEQINSARGSEAHLKNRKETVEAEITVKNRDKEEIITQKAQIDQQVQELTITRDEVRRQLEAVQGKIEELNSQIEAGKNAIIWELNQRATIKSKMGRYDTMK